MNHSHAKIDDAHVAESPIARLSRDWQDRIERTAEEEDRIALLSRFRAAGWLRYPAEYERKTVRQIVQGGHRREVETREMEDDVENS